MPSPARFFCPSVFQQTQLIPAHFNCSSCLHPVMKCFDLCLAGTVAAAAEAEAGPCLGVCLLPGLAHSCLSPSGDQDLSLRLPWDGVAMDDPKLVISYAVSHPGLYFTAMTFCFSNPGENKTQGEQSSPGSGLAVPYSSWCARLELKPAPHQAKSWALAVLPTVQTRPGCGKASLLPGRVN